MANAYKSVYKTDFENLLFLQMLRSLAKGQSLPSTRLDSRHFCTHRCFSRTSVTFCCNARNGSECQYFASRGPQLDFRNRLSTSVSNSVNLWLMSVNRMMLTNFCTLEKDAWIAFKLLSHSLHLSAARSMVTSQLFGRSKTEPSMLWMMEVWFCEAETSNSQSVWANKHKSMLWRFSPPRRSMMVLIEICVHCVIRDCDGMTCQQTIT